MNTSKYKSITLYDAQRRVETGNAYRGITIKIEGLSRDEINRKVEAIRDEQKRKNKEYKEKRMEEMIRQRKEKLAVVRVKNGLTLKLDSKTGNTTFLLGSSKAGKTTALMWLYDKYYSKKKYISILFSINKHIRAYKNHKLLLKCPSFNKQSEKLIMMEKYINSKCRNKYSFVNMFDDMIDVRYNKLLNNLILTYRNSNISSLVSLQYTNLLSKKARSNINNVLLFAFNTDESIEVAVKTFLRGAFAKMGYKSLSDQINFYKKLTKNYGFIYVHPASGHFSVHRLNLRK